MRIVVALYAALLLTIVVLADLGVLAGLVVWMHEVPGADKLAHFVFALGLGAVTARASERVVVLGPLRFPRGLLWVAPIVLLEELSQLFVPGRTFDLLDLAADATGAALGAWGSLLPSQVPGIAGLVTGGSHDCAEPRAGGRPPRGCMRP